MTLKNKRFEIEMTTDEIDAIVEALRNDCANIGREITKLTEERTDQDAAILIARLKEAYKPKKELRDSLGDLIGKRFCGHDF